MCRLGLCAVIIVLCPGAATAATSHTDRCAGVHLQKLKVSEAKEKAATDAAEKKLKQQQESVLKKRELERKKLEAAEAKTKKKEAERQAKEREKLRRARRGPGMAIMEAYGTHSEMCGRPPAPPLPGRLMLRCRNCPLSACLLTSTSSIRARLFSARDARSFIRNCMRGQ